MRPNTTAFPTASNDTTLSLGSIGHDTELAPTVSVCVLLLGLNIAFPSSGPSPGHHQWCRAADLGSPALSHAPVTENHAPGSGLISTSALPAASDTPVAAAPPLIVSVVPSAANICDAALPALMIHIT